MIKAPTMAENRPVYHLVTETDSEVCRLLLTNTRSPVASFFQALEIRLSYSSNVFIYVDHIPSTEFPWAVAEVILVMLGPTFPPSGSTWNRWSKSTNVPIEVQR